MKLVPILMYHNIADSDNKWCVKPSEFKKQMNFIKDSGFITITLDDLYEHIKNGKEIDDESVIITFDDGRESIHRYALPLLKELKLKATLYIVPDWINGKVPKDERYSDFLNWDQIKELSNYFNIGCHGKSHRNLVKLDEMELRKEVFDSKREIEDKIGKKIYHFSYPFGFLNEKIEKMVLEIGYKTAVTANKGMNRDLIKLSRQWVLNNVTINDFEKLIRVPSLSLCMITKDEEKYLADCLNSVKSIVDEIIVVDTGSVDKTKEIAKRFTDKVYDFKWQNDFSKARNFSLSKATKDWILILDADEVIAKKDAEKIKELITNNDIIGYRFVTRNYIDDSSITGWLPARGYEESKDFSGFFPSIKVRLFQNNKDIKFEGIIHELVDDSIERIKGKITLADVAIHHYGAIRDREFKKKKEEYLKLGKMKLSDAKSFYEFGLQNKELGKFDDAIKAFNEVIKLDEKFIDAYYNLGVVYEMQKKYDEAIVQYKKVLNLKKHSDALFGIGVCLLRKDKLEEAANYFEEAIKINPFSVKALINLGAVYERIGDYKKAINVLKKAIQLNPKNAKGYFNLAIAYDKDENFKNAIDAYSKAVELKHEKSKEIIKRIDELKRLVMDIDYSYSVKIK